ncbi:MAG: hypothetical protein ACLFVA_04005 [Dehalococcoidia bacterium]
MDFHRSNRRKTGLKDVDSCELQQYYLSDPRLSSQSGALTGKSRSVDYLHTEYVEIPTWAVRLGLLRKANYTLTERGRALLALHSGASDAAGDRRPEGNPYLLTPSEKYLFLYSLLDADGDTIKRLYRRLIRQATPLSKSDVGGHLLESFEELRHEIKNRRLSVTYRSLDAQLQSAVEAIRNRSDQAIVPRLEPFVDCGLLKRPNRQSSIYETTDTTRRFIGNLNQSASLDEFLNASLAMNTAALLGLVYEKKLEFLPRYLARSYTRLKSGIGYCSIEDLAILAVASSIGDGHGTFELVDVQHAILEFAGQYGTSVRFTKNRQGNLSLVKFDPTLISALIDGERIQ